MTLTAILLLLASAVSANTDVQIKKNTQEATQVTVRLNDASQGLALRYPATVRLEQVFQDTLANLNQLPSSAKNASLYWSGARLWQTSPSAKLEMQQLQLRVAEQLQSLSRHWQAKSPATSRQLQVMAKAFAQPMPGQRLVMPLDWDHIRITPSDNPGLNGSFELQLLTRPDIVKVTGAIPLNTQAGSAQTGEVRLPWQARQNATGYLEQTGQLAVAEPDYVWVIQPDGTTEKHPIAYWNRTHRDIAPGATLFLPFSGLPDELASLNLHLLDLLKQRPF
ncbi:capsule biosynthesis GfcC family protein [Photobacterium sp. GJ3]|uniref:capsule biosynthesis GfcC family protein n=1 Tax=Photobacterium sp. GJ3 TaxID=2829502 RepID=UPI001B8C34A5|nr:capsule biosynthesis GfcC family protein [Photobacterium sp. GJ3]QUJ68194.1 capsule biosynthesis GfcC family protein [Photobacterium sp. GJ3]